MTASRHFIDLAEPVRQIAIRAGSRTLLFDISNPNEKDWFAYFDAVVTTAEQKDREVIRKTDAGAAGLNLLERVLVSASGYPLPEGVTDITQVPNWKAKIPMGHRLAAVNVLLSVVAVEQDDEALVFGDGETVELEALWGADIEGNNIRVKGLKHTFETPSAEHYRAYMNKASQSKVIGGSRSGKTVYQGAQRELVRIYDELIQSVEGYSLDGDRLTREQIIGFMDTRHKVAAAAQLFAAPDAGE